MRSRHVLGPRGSTALAALFVGLGLGAGAGLGVQSAQALDIEWGEVSGSIITSLSVSTQIRMADRDPRNVGISNGGNFPSAGNDDGNLNFDKYDLTTLIGTATSEINLKWQNLGLYIRGTAFYDYIADNNELAVNGPPERGERGVYTMDGQEKARYDAYMQDYFVSGNFQVLDRNLSVRIGSQVLNWGEALFTINAISVINPIDVGRIRVPGAELRDALIPVPMAWASYELADGLSLEGFVTFGFEPFKLEACGAFMSATDSFCDGTRGVGVGTDFKDTRSYYKGRDNPQDNARNYDGISADTTIDDDAEGNDWGIALRYYSPELNNTEFGFYYINYQSRLPSINAFGDYKNPATGTLFGIPGLTDPGFGTAPRSVVLDNLDHGKLTIYYPDDVELYGMSFNTTVDSLGLAINGEISLKTNAPVWVSEPVLTFTVYNNAGGNPLLANQAFGIAPYVENGQPFDPDAPPPLDLNLDEPHDLWNANLRFTKILPTTHWIVSALGANSIIALLEAATIYVDIDPDGPYDYAAYGQNGFSGFSTRPLNPLVDIGAPAVPALSLPEQGDARVKATWKPPTQWSGGFTTLFILDYPAAFGTPINLTPIVAFQTGLFGSTPAPNPGFTKSMNSMYLALKADYLGSYSAQISYFKSWGAGGGLGGSRNPALDRDFIGLTVSYVF
ncbi:DUF1302 family protein [Oleomonas cavernae]|uniref:DUF1302 family protein n=1 Tax=Oleomonas cavernae TaxID=2320859 RepID=A0A418WI90_9PROT|nr:DUF1302 family protein [Oleomonas cavernae]RJF89609.1 DUF1302 family protein [Oleomonas cavernae]